MDSAPRWSGLSGDIKAARTEGHFLTGQPGYRSGEAPWAPDLHDALQSSGVQNG